MTNPLCFDVVINNKSFCIQPLPAEETDFLFGISHRYLYANYSIYLRTPTKSDMFPKIYWEAYAGNGEDEIRANTLTELLTKLHLTKLLAKP